MGTLRSVLDDVVVACFIVFMAAWLFGAVYFGGTRSRSRVLGRFLATRVGIAVVAVVILRPFGTGQSDFLRHLDYWQPVLAVTGGVVAIAATALLLWARWTLGAMWASVPMVQERHRLVTHGPYGIVRHPIYTGLLGLAFG